MKFFNYDSPFWSFMSRIADLVIVNILWLVFCIPVFTIGASTAAMYRVTLNLVRGEGGGVVRSFWASFKLNFKQGVLLFLILLIPTLLVLPNVWGLRGLEVCQPLADVLTLALAVWMMTKVIRAQKAQMAQETA